TAAGSETSIFSLYSSLDKLADAITKFEAGPNPTTETESVRNNNPGNLKFANQDGATEEAGTGFAQFATVQEGRDALLRQLVLYQERTPNLTAEAFVAKYAPGNASGNTPESAANYSTFLRQNANVTPVSTSVPATTPAATTTTVAPATTVPQTQPTTSASAGTAVFPGVSSITAPTATTIIAPQANVAGGAIALPRYEEGGRVPDTGPAILHAGEFV